MRTSDMLPWWMQANLLICGAEGEGEGSTEGEGEGEGKGEGASGSSGSEGEGESSDDDDDDSIDAKDIEGLKSALSKERKNAKTGTKEAGEQKKRADALQARIDELEDKDKSAVEKATAAEKRASERLEKLSGGYKKSAVDRAIEKVARELKFKDTDDAISLVDRSAITVEQDEDDPSDVTVDAKTVKQAVKALADRKKHLIGEPGSEGPSGSKFGGGGNGGKKEATEEQLRAKYPALY